MNVTHLFSALSGLSSVRRYSMTKMTEPESVLEHTGWVTMVACLLALELNSIRPGTILVNTALFKALFHDVDELVTGDVPRPTKYRNEQTIAAFKEMSRWGVEKVVASLDVRANVAAAIVNLHATAKTGREGLIVDISDCMAVVGKLWEEVIVRRNHSMTCHAAKLMEQINNLSKKVEAEFIVPSQRDYLNAVLNECSMMAAKVAAMDEPIFGSNMRE